MSFAAATNCGRLVGALKKMPTHIRWMGCNTAVYGDVSPRETGVRAERSGSKRGTKRRGKRSGRRNARKCRRLVTADPSSDDSLSTKRLYYRSSYLEARLISYVRRSAVYYTKMQRRVTIDRAQCRQNYGQIPIDRDRIKASNAKRFAHLVDIISRVSGSPTVLAKARYCAVVRDTGGNPPSFYFRSFVSGGARHVGYTEVLDMYRDFKLVRAKEKVSQEPVGLVQVATKPISIDVLCWVSAQRKTPSLPPLERRSKTRRPVAKAPCRFCGQAPCRLPGVNTKGIPLCKRGGYTDPALERRRNQG